MDLGLTKVQGYDGVTQPLRGQRPPLILLIAVSAQSKQSVTITATCA